MLFQWRSSHCRNSTGTPSAARWGGDLSGQFVKDGPRPLVAGRRGVDAVGQPGRRRTVRQPGEFAAQLRESPGARQQRLPQLRLAAGVVASRTQGQHGGADRPGAPLDQQVEGASLAALGPEPGVAQRDAALCQQSLHHGGQFLVRIEAGRLGEFADVRGELRVDAAVCVAAAVLRALAAGEHHRAEPVEVTCRHPVPRGEFARPGPQHRRGQRPRPGVAQTAGVQPGVVGGAAGVAFGLAGTAEPGRRLRQVARAEGEVGHLVQQCHGQRRRGGLQPGQDVVHVLLEDVLPADALPLQRADLLQGEALLVRVGGQDPFGEGQAAVRVRCRVRQAGGEQPRRLPGVLAHQHVAVGDHVLGEQLGEGAAVRARVGAGEQAVLAGLPGQWYARRRQRALPLRVGLGKGPRGVRSLLRPDEGLFLAGRAVCGERAAHRRQLGHAGGAGQLGGALLELPAPGPAVDDLQIVLGQLGRVPVPFDVRRHAPFLPVLPRSHRAPPCPGPRWTAP